MTRVNLSEDCGNSPKNLLIQTLTVALAKRDSAGVLELASEPFVWDFVGQRRVEGLEALAGALEALKQEAVEELTVRHVLTHGIAGASNGVLQMADGRTLAFCNVFVFSSAKAKAVREITTYLVELEPWKRG